MPDSPISVSWLNSREKAIAVKRVSDDQLGIKNSTFHIALSRTIIHELTCVSLASYKWEQVCASRGRPEKRIPPC